MKNKIYQSILCVVLTGFMCISHMSIMAKAQGAAGEYNRTDIDGLTQKNADSDYSSYYQSICQKPAATHRIDISAKNYHTNKNAIVETGTYQKRESALIWKKVGGTVEWEFEIPESGRYYLQLDYASLGGETDTIDIGIRLDTSYWFEAMKNIKLPRIWMNDGEIRKDNLGNEFAPKQKEVLQWKSHTLTDSAQVICGGFSFYFEKGKHQLEIEALNAPFALDNISFLPALPVASYQQMNQKGPAYQGEQLVIQAEDAKYKSGKFQVALSAKDSPGLQPVDIYHNKLNYIGGAHWKTPGDTLSWEVDVPESGLYKIGFFYRQTYLLNSNSYRCLKVDGEIPFYEASSIPFAYANGWRWSDFENEQPYFIYLEKGRRVLTLEATMGPFSQLMSELNTVVYDLGKLYRQIVMVTGETPDANRDYALFKQIPNLEKDFVSIRSILEKSAAEIERISGEKGSTNATTLRNMSAVIDRMLSYKFQAQQYKKSFYDNYCTLSAWIYEFQSMPLDLDRIVLAAPEREFEDNKVSFWKSFMHSLKMFAASFVTDYNDAVSVDTKESITLWLNWGRDQAKALNLLTENDFTSKTGIAVHIKIVNATLVQAILSGNGPDCALELSRGEPVNLAIRGALHELNSFADFHDVKKRFQKNAMIPYQFNGNTYALPDTQIFNMLFYRTDIFQELELSVPKTWEEFLNTAAVIQRNNMQVGVPYTQITDMNQTNAGIGILNLFPTIMLQNGQSLYNQNHTATNLQGTESIQAFEFWTELYTKYKFPLSYDFYNRFRTGTMPMAIAPYNQYAVLVVAAPEIEGNWSIAPIPGKVDADGRVNHKEAGGGTGCVILNQSKKKDAAWEFLKWWTDADTQFQFADEVESVLGIAARHPTSNIDSFKMLSYQENDMQVLLRQWENVEDIPEIPGGYYTTRIIDQAFWNTVYKHKNPKDTIVDWSRQADLEIKKKRKEYALQS